MLQLKITTRSQKRKAVEQLASSESETSVVGNNSVGNLVAAPSESPRLQIGNLDDTKTSLRQEIISDPTKILAENQDEESKLMVPFVRKNIGPSKL